MEVYANREAVEQNVCARSHDGVTDSEYKHTPGLSPGPTPGKINRTTTTQMSDATLHV